jgi:hypothetical protein
MYCIATSSVTTGRSKTNERQGYRQLDTGILVHPPRFNVLVPLLGSKMVTSDWGVSCSEVMASTPHEGNRIDPTAFEPTLGYLIDVKQRFVRSGLVERTSSRRDGGVGGA